MKLLTWPLDLIEWAMDRIAMRVKGKTVYQAVADGEVGLWPHMPVDGNYSRAPCEWCGAMTEEQAWDQCGREADDCGEIADRYILDDGTLVRKIPRKPLLRRQGC